MAGGGQFRIKGGRAVKGQAIVDADGNLLVALAPGSLVAGGGFIEHSFRRTGAGSTTELDVMDGDPIGPGLTVLRTVEANLVGVSVLHDASPDGGTWTLRLFRKAAPATTFSEVATFIFDT